MVDYKKTGLMKAGMVTCCGQVVSLDAAEVQRVMCERGLSPAEQAQEWLRLMRRHAEPEWMELCMRSAERMAALVRAEREVQAVVGTTVDSASGGEGRRMPSEGLAPRHFEWLGAQRGVRVDLVRTAISSLVQKGYIGSDAEQQAALRRGLGIAVNEAERTSRAPWVRWMGDADALNYLVDTLWKRGLIYCTGGQRQKWRTLCGVFLRDDGSLFDPAIKGNRCTNPGKRTLIDRTVMIFAA